TFNRSGRTLDLRTWIYETALTVFREQPLTGSGLFTFGGELARLNSTPYHEPHSHAHSLIFNVMAELGVIGLAALALTVVLLLRTLLRHLRAERMALDAERAGAWAAVAGVGVHLLFDTTIMMPALALGVLLAALSSLTPSPLVGEGARSEGRRAGLALSLLGVCLAAAAIWSTTLYTRYVAALSTAVGDGDLIAGAAALDSVIAADPGLAITHSQRGMLLALAGDADGARQSFERYTELAPQYAVGWFNLAALRLASGDRDGARQALDRALALAPDLASLQFPVSADPFALEWEFGGNIPYAQFMRLAILRLFVPQIALLGEDVTFRTP
ncbi:MAG: O-antigen ligase family protein, partial [Anaerolineae bacterium]|nr:O-antigen ligase family protein [Anaerolineae bacterium]